MPNFNKKKLVSALKNARISGSNVQTKTPKLDKKKYVPEWKKKAKLLPKSKSVKK